MAANPLFPASTLSAWSSVAGSLVQKPFIKRLWEFEHDKYTKDDLESMLFPNQVFYSANMRQWDKENMKLITQGQTKQDSNCNMSFAVSCLLDDEG